MHPTKRLAAAISFIGLPLAGVTAGPAGASAPPPHGSASVVGHVESASGLVHSAAGVSARSGLTASVLGGVPGGAGSPDDIVSLGGDIFVAYQNGVGPLGQAAPSGAVASTVVQYHRDGYLVTTWSLVGKVDGLTADPVNNRLIATVNEDGNSSIYTIHPSAPAAGQVVHLTYSPAALSWGGGTDAPRVFNGSVYISASAPAFANTTPVVNPGTVPALIQVTLDEATGTATWTSAFAAQAGNPAELASDPDSNNVVPTSSPVYGGDFVLVSQGDGQLYFIANPGPTARATDLQLQGTQADDIEFATASTGTLYVVDAGTGKIVTLSGTYAPGTAFVGVPGDSTVPSFVGVADLTSGVITPVLTGLKSPAGLLFVPGTAAPGPYGYRLTAADGGTFNYGDSTPLGSLGGLRLNKPIVGSATTPDRRGQYLVASDGGVFTFGDATFAGSLGAAPSSSPVVGITVTADYRGYWLAAADGTVTAFGTAANLGSLSNPPAPVVGIAPTHDGGGYWLTTAKGGVYAYGDAKALGGISDQPLNGPIVGIAATQDGFGYWLTGSDGGVFAFGDAPFVGSAGGIKLNKPVVGMVATSSDAGYQLVASDGGVFTFGDAGFYGSAAVLPLNKPVVAIGS